MPMEEARALLGLGKPAPAAPEGNSGKSKANVPLGRPRKLGSMVSKWVITYPYRWSIWLLTSWDIQAGANFQFQEILHTSAMGSDSPPVR